MGAAEKNVRTVTPEAFAMAGLLQEAMWLGHRMKTEAQRHGLVTGAGLGNWGVLRDIAENGPQTVPVMAAKRPVARQRIQRIVDELMAEGLVRLVANPAHKRSRLVALTAAGRRREATLTRRFDALCETLAQGLDATELIRAAALLAATRQRLASEGETGTG